MYEHKIKTLSNTTNVIIGEYKNITKRVSKTITPSTNASIKLTVIKSLILVREEKRDIKSPNSFLEK